MRFYVHGRRTGVSFGLFGGLAFTALAVMCALALIGLVAEALAAVVPAALLALAAYAISQRAAAHREYMARSVRICWSQPEDSRRWVYRERWPHAVVEGGWLDRHR